MHTRVFLLSSYPRLSLFDGYSVVSTRDFQPRRVSSPCACANCKRQTRCKRRGWESWLLAPFRTLSGRKEKNKDKMAFSASFRPVNRVLVKKWKAQKKDADNEWMAW